MAHRQVHLRIITPDEIKADEHADMVVIRCVNGDMGVLPGHHAYSAALDIGALTIINGVVERKIAIFGGIASIENDTVTVLTDNAEWPEDINITRAHEDRERVERRIQESADDIVIQRDQLLLRRSLVRIEVSSEALISEGQISDE